MGLPDGTIDPVSLYQFKPNKRELGASAKVNVFDVHCFPERRVRRGIVRRNTLRKRENLYKNDDFLKRLSVPAFTV